MDTMRLAEMIVYREEAGTAYSAPVTRSHYVVGLGNEGTIGTSVAIPMSTIRNSATPESAIQALDGYLQRAAATAAAAPQLNDVRTVGTWIDVTTDLLWIDAGTLHYYQDTALDVAAARGELAIWDTARGTEIRV